ncbi:MAG TPA: EAL domain-containing protein [Gemmatimonadaceae bacterium]|nr:EAL domain-containing protein [Gemmatimonadaceae bacterium]
MTAGIVLTDSTDEIDGAIATIAGWSLVRRSPGELCAGIDELPDLRGVLVTTPDPAIQRAAVEHAHARGVAVVMACADAACRRRAVELGADEWYRSAAASDEEIAWRLQAATLRVAPVGASLANRVRRESYEDMLFDTLTGLPTIPVMIERTRAEFKANTKLIVLYLHFVRYSKIEEIYGWEKLDDVLETTATSVREYLDSHRLRATRMMVSYANDDDFVFFHVPTPESGGESEQALTDLTGRVRDFVIEQLEQTHGEEIAALVDVYVGSAHAYYDPKIRLERLIYRAIREAANDARSVEERERLSKISDLRRTLREGSVYVDYHPIVRTDSGEVFGYEALARGQMRRLRSPEVMFEVAAEVDLVWELSRLCRTRAIEGMATRLQPNELLFLNVDPHDFADPLLEGIPVPDPSRVVIEITERTAIRDYPAMRARLARFRERGFRIAVDDAGAGYAGLGSIANLEPDFIKLDISLISLIDTNFLKQNLVETLVRFSEEHGALVIAEGVERHEELETLKRLGVQLVQGFLLHRAPRPDAMHMLTAEEMRASDGRAKT